jgi:hypothetical protein
MTQPLRQPPATQPVAVGQQPGSGRPSLLVPPQPARPGGDGEEVGCRRLVGSRDSRRTHVGPADEVHCGPVRGVRRVLPGCGWSGGSVGSGGPLDRRPSDGAPAVLPGAADADPPTPRTPSPPPRNDGPRRTLGGDRGRRGPPGLYDPDNCRSHRVVHRQDPLLRCCRVRGSDTGSRRHRQR